MPRGQNGRFSRILSKRLLTKDRLMPSDRTACERQAQCDRRANVEAICGCYQFIQRFDMLDMASGTIVSASSNTWRRPAGGDNHVALTWIQQRIEQPRIRALDADHANAHHHASLPFPGSSSELSDQGLIGDRPAAFRPIAPDRRPGWRIAGGERFHRRLVHDVNRIVG
jgi:hypothetical protein